MAERLLDLLTEGSRAGIAQEGDECLFYCGSDSKADQSYMRIRGWQLVWSQEIRGADHSGSHYICDV